MESLAGPCPASFAPPVSVSSAAVVCSFPCPSCHPCLPCLLRFSRLVTASEFESYRHAATPIITAALLHICVADSRYSLLSRPRPSGRSVHACLRSDRGGGCGALRGQRAAAQPPFHLEEATIFTIHSAFASGQLTCTQLTKLYLD